MDGLKYEMLEALKSLDRLRIGALFQKALSDDLPLHAIEEVIVPALAQLGEDWNDGRIALSQVYMSSRICEDLVERILPPQAPERRSQPRQAIVVLGDYHLLGKRIVLSIMRASGFDLLDFGRMDVEELVERIVTDEVKILLISVLMLPAALKVKELRTLLNARGIRIKIAVGGAPFLFDPELWREVGADAMGRNATDAVAIVRKWVEEATC